MAHSNFLPSSFIFIHLPYLCILYYPFDGEGGHALIAPTNKVGLYTDSVCKLWDISFLFSRFVHRPCTIRCFPNLNQYFQKRRWVFEYRFSTFLFDGKVGRSRLGFRSQFTERRPIINEHLTFQGKTKPTIPSLLTFLSW